MSFKDDLYKLLGIERDATEDEIKAAYRDRAKKTHPDKGGDREEFERVTEASNVLLDPRRREKYDKTGDAEDDGPDDIGKMAMNHIVTMFNGFLDSNDQEKLDLMTIMTKKMREESARVRQGGKDLEFRRAKLEKLVKRFTKKNPGSNIFVTFTQAKISKIAQEIQSHTNLADSLDLAVEMLQDYEYEWDKPPPPPVVEPHPHVKVMSDQEQEIRRAIFRVLQGNTA
jgi:curved DNA-binding protein CbpA